MQTNISKIYKNKTILITGGTGYVGSCLTHALSKIDCHLKVLSKSSSSWTPESNNANMTLLYGDVSNFNLWNTIIDDVDYIFHLASVDGVNDYKLEIDVNAMSMLHLINACKSKGLSPKIVFSSSANIFGNVSNVPVNEEFPDNPESLWSIHKLLVEQYLKLYYYQFNINSVCLRLPNVFGMSPNKQTITRTVINKVIYKALNGENLFLYSNHNCIRDYIFIDDAISALLLAGGIEKDISKGQFYVIGSGQGKTISEAWKLISQKVSEKLGEEVIVEKDSTFKPTPMEMRNFVANTSNFNNVTGWNSEITLEEGIDLTVEAMWDSLHIHI
jgi:nucleoside-diphosphate-sugar epimerase